MITIFTGNINSGKSTSMYNHYKGNAVGDGFILKKVFNLQSFIGYEILWISNNISSPFIYKSDNLPYNWDEIYNYGKFSFSNQGLNFAEHIIESAVKSNKNPIYIDEIGPLELNEMCFFNIFNKVLQLDKFDLIIAVRSQILNDVLLKFQIDNPIIVNVD